MNLALGIIALWLGATLLYLAAHGLEATSPWSAFQTVIERIGASA